MSTKVRVQFIKGPVANYSAENYVGAIYFATDEKKIYVDGIAYGGDIDTTRIVSGVTWSEGKLYVQYLDGTMTAMDPEIPVATTTTAGLMSAEDKVKLDGIKDVEFVYDSAIEDVTLEMPNAVGGIAKGTTVESLEGRTISEILDDLLFPTVNPTYVAPSVTLSISGYSLTQEVGATAPTADNFTHSFSAGAINLNGVKQANRAGAETSESFIYVNNSASNNVLPETVALGDTTYKYRAYYAEGAQPKDNKGNDYQSPLAAGYVDSSKVTINGTYPWYASTVTSGVLDKQALVNWSATVGGMTTPKFEVQPHTPEAPQMIKTPRAITSMQMLNTVSNQMETISYSNWSVSESTEMGITYYTYTYTGDTRGAVKLIVKF